MNSNRKIKKDNNQVKQKKRFAGKSIKKWMYRILFLAALSVFVYSGIKLIGIFMDYQGGAKEYANLQEFTAGGNNDVLEIDTEKNNEEAKSDNLSSEPAFSVDFEKLKAENPDCVGWIRFENLNISYPIMQGTDNDYYLQHTFYGEQRTAASIFVDYRNKSDFIDSNTLIYGHKMKDKTMFGKLNDYENESFFKENPSFYVYTPDMTYRYDIFASETLDESSNVFRHSFSEKKQIDSWIKAVLGYSSYDTKIVPKTTDKMITLVTCTPGNEENRFLVHGVQREAIPVGEKNE